ncbi:MULTISPECIES: hypothetical protein [unclassified Schlesneria]|uniref:hypothetical protein n=1 Tax=Schlesneria TaxID=656899 RepID=UPI002F1AE5E4
MTQPGMDRREFQQLSLAALCGVVAGVNLGCSNGGGGAGTPAAAPAAPGAAAAANQINLTPEAEALIMDEPHTCRGLNSCKGLGRDKENACAGQGTCASVADSVCGGHNDCKGQGGCGENPGMNSCKGQGGCHIPLMSSAWETARTAFEAAMKKNGKEFGAAPAAAK